MNQELRDAYETCVSNAAAIKRLTAESDAAKAVIKKWHKDTDRELICEDGFQSAIVHSSRSTFDASLLEKKFDQIEKAFGVVIPPEMRDVKECYRVKQYDSFTVKRLLVEDSREGGLTSEPVF